MSDSAGRDDPDAVTQLQSTIHGVGGHYHCATVLPEFAYDVVQQLNGGFVQARLRFVEEQQSRPVQERPGEGDPPLESIRKFPGQVVEAVLYLHDASDFGHPFVTVGHAEHSCVEEQVFAGCQVAVQHWGVQNGTGHLADDFTGARHVPAVDAYATRVRASQGGEDAQEGGLSGAVWAEQRQDFVSVRIQVNAS